MHAAELLERDSQLAELGGRLELTREGRGGLVLVTGEAGTGKTTLVRAAIEGSGSAPWSPRRPRRRASRMPPIASLIRAHLRDRPDSLAAVGSLAPYLSLILPELGPRAPPSATALVEAVSAWFVGLGRLGRVAVVIDDLQWADSATIDLLPRLAADLEHVPVVLVATYRRDEVTRGHSIRKLRVVLRRAGRLAEIEVEPLGPAGRWS